MKKLYTSLFAFAAALSSQAQLTQANHAPVAGDTYTVLQCDTVGPGASGAGSVWTFSTINTHSSIVSNYSAAAVSGNTAYPNANVAVASTVNNMSYYNATSSALYYHGGNIVVGPVSAALLYTAPAVYAAYPMGINTSSTATTGGSINVTSPFPVTGTFNGTSHVIADGTGTIHLPGSATYTNVTRVVTSQTISFVAGTSGTVTQRNYDYYDPSLKAPLFTISTATVITSLSPTPNTQTIVTRNKSAVGTGTNPGNPVGLASAESSVISLNVYPNPSSTIVNFSTDSRDAAQVLVYDMTGRLVEKQNLTEGKAKVDVSSYNKGLYLYSVVSSNSRVLKSGKLTVTQ